MTRSSSASRFVLHDDVEVLFGEEAEELLAAHQAAQDGDGTDGPDCTNEAESGDADCIVEAQSGDGGSSRALDARCARMMELRSSLMEEKRQHVISLSSWSSATKLTLVSWLSHSPVPSLFSRSITISRSMRTLLFIVDLLGAMMLCTLFLSASGGALSKKSSKACPKDCNLLSGDDFRGCLQQQLGRLIAITLMSVTITNCLVAVLTKIHRRDFVRVDYEGSLAWRRKLWEWRRNDMIFWMFGLAWCVFVINLVCLFFANVVDADRANWVVSVGLGVLEEIIVLPAAVALIIGIIMRSSLVYLATRHGVSSSTITQHGSFESLGELLRCTDDRDDIWRVLTGSVHLETYVSEKKKTLEESDWSDLVPTERKRGWESPSPSADGDEQCPKECVLNLKKSATSELNDDALSVVSCEDLEQPDAEPDAHPCVNAGSVDNNCCAPDTMEVFGIEA